VIDPPRVECEAECEIRMTGQSYPLAKSVELSIRAGWLELTKAR